MVPAFLLGLCLLLQIGFTSSLRASTVRELSGLYSKTKYYSSSLNAGADAAIPPKISATCQKAVRNLRSSGLIGKYIDATGRPNSGLTLGNLVWLGSYETCKTIPDAQYCLAPGVTFTINIEGNITKLPYISWGLCVPSACTEEDIAIGIGTIAKVVMPDLPYLGGNITLSGVFCAHKSKWTNGAIITLALCIIIAALCLVGTLVDMFVVQQAWKFWVTSSEYNMDSVGGLNENGILHTGSSHHLETEEAPLLSSYGTSSHKSINPAIEIRRPIKTENRGFVVNFLVCFSMIRNTTKIMNCSVPAGAISAINGIRVLSMWWVIMGHTYLWLIIYRTLNDFALALDISRRFSFQAVNNAFFSVDSFFVLSGLLVAYLSFRRLDKNDGRLPLFQFYFHRFWRLTPAYMFVILFYANLTPFLGEGPLWYGSQKETPCHDYWWTNLLYINNFHPNSLLKECLGWSWYLANDMQFYVISPILIYIIYRFQFRGLLTGVGTLLLASLVVTAVIIGVYNTDVLESGEIQQGFKQKQGRGSYSDLVYIKPYCRIAPYLVGIALGYLIHVDKKTPGKNPLSKLPRRVECLVGWFLSIALGVSVVYGVYTYYKEDGRPFTRAKNIIYGTFSRFVWGLALAWVIYACNKGYGSLVNKFLSASYWIHPQPLDVQCVSSTSYRSRRLLLDLSNTLLSTAIRISHFIMLTVVVMSYAAAFILAIGVEFPTMQLENVLFFRCTKSRD
ncbi:O-acyltransferase like protein-like [Stylophora pistillata]|uniref:O-acyltransferase like protein-like n=1 Tax=Stylophora pistillata TaxID=50429 RepID=UPI000C03D1B0|nr:O-acyltransferase like protein-like [Stylophora pistillata]